MEQNKGKMSYSEAKDYVRDMLEMIDTQCQENIRHSERQHIIDDARVMIEVEFARNDLILSPPMKSLFNTLESIPYTAKNHKEEKRQIRGVTKTIIRMLSDWRIQVADRVDALGRSVDDIPF